MIIRGAVSLQLGSSISCDRGGMQELSASWKAELDTVEEYRIIHIPRAQRVQLTFRRENGCETKHMRRLELFKYLSIAGEVGSVERRVGDPLVDRGSGGVEISGQDVLRRYSLEKQRDEVAGDLALGAGDEDPAGGGGARI